MNQHQGSAELAAASIRLIIDLQHPSGAYPASPTFSAYQGYSWFRDGAFISDGLSAWAGVETDPEVARAAIESATAFHDWCANVLLQHRASIERAVDLAQRGEQLPGSQMLPARFTFDGGLGSDDWTDFQLDGYGTWLWSAVVHANRHGVSLSRWSEAIDLAIDYLTSSWERSCYDWWEEHEEQVHVSTLGCIGAGLETVLAAGILTPERARQAQRAAIAVRERVEGATHDGHLVKWLGHSAVDASLSALVSPLGYLEPSSALAAATLDAVERDLTVDGGTHRFLADVFYGGGQWPLLSCFLGLGRLAQGNTTRAGELLDWATAAAGPTRTMPEQVRDHLLAPEHHQEWVERWGPVADPLLWSHAMHLRLLASLTA